MKHAEIYRDWIEVHQRVDAHPDLVANVMREIQQAEPVASEHVSMWVRLIEWIDASVWLKAAAVGAAGVIGVGRIVFGIHLLLAFRLLGV